MCKFLPNICNQDDVGGTCIRGSDRSPPSYMSTCNCDASKGYFLKIISTAVFPEVHTCEYKGVQIEGHMSALWRPSYMSSDYTGVIADFGPGGGSSTNNYLPHVKVFD